MRVAGGTEPGLHKIAKLQERLDVILVGFNSSKTQVLMNT